MSRKLYANERLLDLFPAEPIPLTYQANNIAELENRQANFSNSFNIPDTNNNRIALGYSNLVPSNTNLPYRKVPMRYFQNGVPIFDNGFLIIEDYTGVFNITLYSGIFDFFSQLGERTLKDIDWSEYSHTYDVATVAQINADYLSGDSDVCMPFIQYGGQDSLNIDIKYQCFNFRFSTIIDKIFELTTYSKSGQIFNDGIYLDMALTLNPDQQEPDDTVLEERSYQVLAPGGLSDAGVSITNGPNISNILGLFTVVFDSSNNVIRDTVNPSTISWPATWIPAQTLNTTRYRSTYYGTIEVNTKLLFGAINITGSEYYRIFKNNVEVRYVQIGDYPASNGNTFGVSLDDTFVIDVIPGDEIKVYFYGINWSIDSTDISDNHVTITNISTIPLGGPVNYNYLIPNLKLRDVIRSFCQQFALTITNTSTEIVFTKFSEITANQSQAEDWSDKLDLTIPPTVEYRIGDYAQLNHFKWLPSDQTKGFGDSSFTVDNEVLQKETTVIEMIYPSCTPYENIRTTSYKFLPLPLADYYDLPQWSLFVEYNVDDEVASQGVIFVCIQYISGLVAVDVYNDDYWEVRSDQYLTNQKNEGVQIPRFTKVEADEWDIEKEYNEDELVTYGSIIYVAQQTTTGNVPSAPASAVYWQPRTLQYEQTITSESRLVLIRPLTRVPNILRTQGVWDNTITYTDGVTSLGTGSSAYPVAYWSDSLEAYNLTGQYLLDTFYPDIIRMLQQLKLVGCYMRLSEADINQLNFLKLKYVKYFGNYFYLNMVEDYIENQSSKVQLIRK